MDYAEKFSITEIVNDCKNATNLLNSKLGALEKLSKIESDCNLPHVSKCEGIERRDLLIDFHNWSDRNNRNWLTHEQRIMAIDDYLKSINNC